jgi:hypothetical protein
MGIDMIFIPAGQTGELQPLETTVFGELKSKGASVCTKQYLKDPKRKTTKESSSIRLQECWEEIHQTSFQRVWETVFKNLRNKVVREIDTDTTESSHTSDDGSYEFQTED